MTVQNQSRALLGLRAALRPWLGLIIVCVGFTSSSTFRHAFWSREYLPILGQQVAPNVILATGLTFVIITGGIDLSVGSVLGLCGVALGMALKGHAPLFLGMLAAVPVAAFTGWIAHRAAWPTAATVAAAITIEVLTGYALFRVVWAGISLPAAIMYAAAVGCGCGAVNGLVVTQCRVPPFVATLGMFTVARGLTVYATDGNSISGFPPNISILGEGWPLILITGALFVLAALLLGRTRYGRHVRAVGGSEETARLSGVSVGITRTVAYTLCGFSAACAGVLLTAKFGVAQTNAGTGAELAGIAAVVIGGTSLAGGEGSVIGSLVGALTIGVLNSGLVLVGVIDTLQEVVLGLVIVATVALDRMRRLT